MSSDTDLGLRGSENPNSAGVWCRFRPFARSGEVRRVSLPGGCAHAPATSAEAARTGDRTVPARNRNTAPHRGVPPTKGRIPVGPIRGFALCAVSRETLAPACP
ncbi:hypothetical protein GCM10018787_03380 [Streptomyces thermodiastaticus]|nr:hypothetical protein GCM10018787_03380 [Streptomyces thermodiastaticus]